MEINLGRGFFNEAYLPYINDDSRFLVFMGGAGSGKSRFICQKLVINLLQKKTKILVIRQTYSTIKDSVFSEFITVLDQFNLTDKCKITKTPLYIQLPNGSEILFKGTDSETKLLSISGIEKIWAEESYEISLDIWNTLITRLRGKGIKKQFILSFNPISQSSWLYDYFWTNRPDDCKIIHTTYLDNKFLDDEYVKALEDLKRRDYERYKVYCLGEWGVTGKRTFTNYRVENFDWVDLIKENPNRRVATGVDFGFSIDPATCIASVVDMEEKKLWVFSEIWEKGLLNKDFAKKIKEKNLHKAVIFADSAEPKTISEMRSQYGLTKMIGVKKGAGSIKAGVEWLKSFEIIISPDCPHLKMEMDNYSYKKNTMTGQYYPDKFVGDDHCIDALRYSVSDLVKVNKIRGISKSVLGL